MTPAFTARGRAEEFNSLVEGTSTSELTRERYVDVLEVVEAMRYVAPVQARPAFVADLRERLMTAAETALTPATDDELRARLTVAPRRTPRERRIAVAIGGFAMLGATTSMAMAAQTALPGDTLYPLKRALENARAGVQADDSDRGATLLGNASARLDELDELTSSESSDSRTIAETLQAFTEQASSASDLLIASYQSTGEESAIAELNAFTTASLADLEGLERVVPVEARASLIEAVQVLDQINRQALYACPSCAPNPAQVPTSATTPIDDLLAQLTETTTTPGQEAGPGSGDKRGQDGKGGTADGDGGSNDTGTSGDGSSSGGTQDGGTQGSDPGGGQTTSPTTPPLPGGGPQGGDSGQGPLPEPPGGVTDGGQQAPTEGPTSLPSNLGEHLGDVVDGVTEPLTP